MDARRTVSSAEVLSRVVRVVIGLVMLTSVFVGPRTPLGWMGILPLMTGLLGGCPTMGCSTGTCATRPPEKPE